MPRPLRTDYPGAFHHVMNRGARRAPIFVDSEDCLLLLDVLDEAARRFGVEVHAYALIPNHYHLLLRSVGGDLSRVMKLVNGRYTQRLNQQHKWDGPVFRGRFQSRLVRSPRYLRYLLPYLHLNPVRAHLVARPDMDCWTSHRAYLGLEPKPSWLTTQYFLRLLGGRAGLKDLVTGLHQGRIPWPPGADLESGWLLDDEETPAAVPPQDPPATTRPAAPPASKAPRPGVAELLARVAAITGASSRRLREAEFGPSANPERRFAVWALIRRGALTHGEAAEALRMTPTAVAKVSSRSVQREQTEAMREWMRRWDEGGPVG